MSEPASTVFGHVELSCDPEAAGRPCFSFRSIKGRPFPLFTLQPLQANGDCSYLAVAADLKAPDVFHLIGCRRSAGCNSYVFLEVDDVLDLGKELHLYGVSGDAVARWNARHPEAPVPVGAAGQAAAVLGRFTRKAGRAP